ncbi:unnamed protein product [Phaeothamnion confervicola]
MKRLRSMRSGAKKNAISLERIKEAATAGNFSDSESDGESKWNLRRHVSIIRKMKLLSRVRDLPTHMCLPDLSADRQAVANRPLEPNVFVDRDVIDRIVNLAAWAGYECCCQQIRIRLPRTARDPPMQGSQSGAAATEASEGAGAAAAAAGANGNGYAPPAESGPLPLNGHIPALGREDNSIGVLGCGILCHLLYRHHAVNNFLPLSPRPGAANAAVAVDDESTDDEDLFFHDAEFDGSESGDISLREANGPAAVAANGAASVTAPSKGNSAEEAAAAAAADEAGEATAAGLAAAAGANGAAAAGANVAAAAAAAHAERADGAPRSRGSSTSGDSDDASFEAALSNGSESAFGEGEEDQFQDACDRAPSPVPSSSNGCGGRTSVGGGGGWGRRSRSASPRLPVAWRVTFIVQGRPYVAEVWHRTTAPVCCLLGEVLRVATLVDGSELSWSPTKVTLVDAVTGAGVAFTDELSRPGQLPFPPGGSGSGGGENVGGGGSVRQPVLRVVICAADRKELRNSLLEADGEDTMPQDVYDSLPPELKRSLEERRQREQQQLRRPGCVGGVGGRSSHAPYRSGEGTRNDAGGDAAAAERPPLPYRPRGGAERFFCPSSSVPWLGAGLCPMDEPFNCWEEPAGPTFKVRGLTYMADGKKVPSAEAAYVLLGIDLLVSEETHHQVGSRENGFVQRFRRERGELCPFVLILNFSLPWGSFLAYLCPRHGGPSPFVGDEKFDNLLRRILEGGSSSGKDGGNGDGGGGSGGNTGGGDADGGSGGNTGGGDADGGSGGSGEASGGTGGPDFFRNNRLKIVPRCHAGPWLVRQTVGGKPAIIGNKIKQVYHGGVADGWFEIETDINSSMAALYILAVVKNYTTAVAVDLGFVIQGDGPEELPERLVGALRFHHLDVAGAPDFDIWEARPPDT